MKRPRSSRPLMSCSVLLLPVALLLLLCLLAGSLPRAAHGLLSPHRGSAVRRNHGGAFGGSTSAASRSPLFVLNAVDMRTKQSKSQSQRGNREQAAWDSWSTRRQEQAAWDSIAVAEGLLADEKNGAVSLAYGANSTSAVAFGDGGGEAAASFGPPDLDAMRARAGLLRATILRQQVELQDLERGIQCCESASLGTGSGPVATMTDTIVGLFEEEHPLQAAAEVAGRSITTLASSTNVLLRKLSRVHTKSGPQNQQWENVGDFVSHQSKSGMRIVKSLVDNPERLTHLVDPETPSLVPHVPAILARLDRLEDHVAPILERVLNNRRHLASVEPYLDEILERFDDIEPHLPWILDNIDALAPYTGLLLKHIDELLLYADVDEHEAAIRTEADGTQYDLAEQLLPYLEYYVSKLDVVGPHLPLLRPHVPLLLKHNRLARVSPHIDRLFARGYADLSASANMDVLLFWFGWSLRVPGLPKLFFWLPWSPRIVSILANRLPKRFVRGRCSGVSCVVDGSYGSQWNKLEKS